jgi:molecular chaperone DnaJ
VVETPVNLNKKQEELLRDFDESIRASKRTHDPRASSWLDSVKKFFEDLTS